MIRAIEFAESVLLDAVTVRTRNEGGLTVDAEGGAGAGFRFGRPERAQRPAHLLCYALMSNSAAPDVLA
jgi:hypothetical protein